MVWLTGRCMDKIGQQSTAECMYKFDGIARLCFAALRPKPGVGVVAKSKGMGLTPLAQILRMQRQPTGLLRRHGLAILHPRFVPESAQRGALTSGRVTTIRTLTSYAPRTSTSFSACSSRSPGDSPGLYSAHDAHDTVPAHAIGVRICGQHF